MTATQTIWTVDVRFGVTVEADSEDKALEIVNAWHKDGTLAAKFADAGDLELDAWAE